GNNVVAGGADEFGKFALVSIEVANTLLAGLHLTSDGSPVTHAEAVDIPLLGTIMGFFAEDGRLIMTLTVGEFGNYDIRLFDQVDHPVGDNLSTTAPEAVQDTLSIDLGHFVTYTDFDGDKIDLGTGHLVLDIVDDIPEAVAGAQVIATVEEEDGTLTLSG